MSENEDIESGIFSAANEFAIPDTKYTDFAEVSSAGFSRLVKAKRQGRWWMLKTLRPEYALKAFYQSLLQKEFQVLSQLSHPNIVTCVGMEQIENYGACIVMEYIEGAPLDARTYKKDERVRLAMQLSEVLEYLHSMQIVHRDIKPQNILVTTNGCNLKLIDFGLADTDSHAVLKQPAGTRSYISPEQLADGVPDARNDLYSAGRVLQDLQLGWQYGFIIRRLLRPINKRYQNATELRKAMRFARRIPLLLEIIFIAVVVAGMSVGIAMWLMPTSTTVVVRHDKELADSVGRLNKQLSKASVTLDSLNAKLDESKEIQDALQSRVDLEDEQKAYFEQCFKDGCKKIDKFYVDTKYCELEHMLVQKDISIDDHKKYSEQYIQAANVRLKLIEGIVEKARKSGKLADHDDERLQSSLWNYNYTIYNQKKAI